MGEFVAIFPLAIVKKTVGLIGKKGIRARSGILSAVYHRNVQGVSCGNGPLHGACHLAWLHYGIPSGMGCYIGQSGDQRWPG